MSVDDLLAGDAVFVDANIFTYHFQPHPTWGASCTRLLQRIENQELNGFTSIAVLGEVAHRLMTIEAHTALGWPFAGIGTRMYCNWPAKWTVHDRPSLPASIWPPRVVSQAGATRVISGTTSSSRIRDMGCYTRGGMHGEPGRLRDRACLAHERYATAADDRKKSRPITVKPPGRQVSSGLMKK